MKDVVFRTKHPKPWAYDPVAASGRFEGFMSHFHCSKKKIDVGGLDIKKLFGEIK